MVAEGSGHSGATAPRGDTRNRVLAVAMELFGRHGYGPTTVAQIERAAGLSAGAGGLYRHFPSKKALLIEGLRREGGAGRALLERLDDLGQVGAAPRERLLAVGRAGLARLEQERDLNRLLVRDLDQFPELLEQVREQEVEAVFRGLSRWLAGQPDGRPDTDWDALAAVLLAAVSHYWILRDVYGGKHPHQISAERFLGMLTDLAATVFTGVPDR